MPTHPGPDLRKVTLNLFEEDCVTLEKFYGRGWSTAIRDAVLRHAQNLRSIKAKSTLADLNEYNGTHTYPDEN